MKTISLFPILIGLMICLTYCMPPQQGDSQQKDSEQDQNPAAEGFNAQESDSAAIAIADSVMQAMGGRKAWDHTRYIAWNFFDVRKLVWDKQTGNVRVTSLNNDFTAVFNINTMDGKVKKDGEIISNPDSLNHYINQAKKYWINDSYWLVMPYKLKDSGVTLTYMGDENTSDFGETHKLQLTFDNVGVTPQNKYHVWVDDTDYLVRKWAFFRNYDQDTAMFETPWQDYKKHGEILLSGDRGQRQITDIMVFEDLPAEVFNSLEEIELESISQEAAA